MFVSVCNNIINIIIASVFKICCKMLLQGNSFSFNDTVIKFLNQNKGFFCGQHCKGYDTYMVELSIIPNVNMKIKQFLQDSKQNVAAILAVLKKQKDAHLITKLWLSISLPHSLSSRMPEFPTTAQVLNLRFFIGETSGRRLCRSCEIFSVRRLSST